jgi:hypothetical protein
MERRVSIWQLWAKAQPWQRRNLVLTGIALFWAGALYVGIVHTINQGNIRTAPMHYVLLIRNNCPHVMACYRHALVWTLIISPTFDIAIRTSFFSVGYE